jgi:uncharacterized protein (TIGR03067 family)
MMRHIVTIVAAVILIAADGPRPLDEQGGPDLRGEWRLVYGMEDGSEWPGYESRRVKMAINVDRQFEVWHGGGLVIGRVGSLKFDPTTAPQSVDSTATGGGVSVVSQGIYEFSGDTYRVCFAAPGEPRPTDFTCGPGSGRSLQVWRRAAAR